MYAMNGFRRGQHPIQYKMAAYQLMLNRLHSLPLSREHKNLEMNAIIQIANRMDTQ